MRYNEQLPKTERQQKERHQQKTKEKEIWR
jgi:hypothetical protein